MRPFEFTTAGRILDGRGRLDEIGRLAAEVCWIQGEPEIVDGLEHAYQWYRENVATHQG